MTGSAQLAFEKTSVVKACAPFLLLPFFAEVAAKWPMKLLYI